MSTYSNLPIYNNTLNTTYNPELSTYYPSTSDGGVYTINPNYTSTSYPKYYVTYSEEQKLPIVHESKGPGVTENEVRDIVIRMLDDNYSLAATLIKRLITDDLHAYGSIKSVILRIIGERLDSTLMPAALIHRLTDVREYCELSEDTKELFNEFITFIHTKKEEENERAIKLV